MDLTPRPLALPRVRTDWALAPPRPAARDDAEIARQFETIIAETLLRSARAASLGDDSFAASAGGDDIRATIDHARAEAIARAAPLGIARLLAADARR
jgi:Rod binding domain-containing protein